MNDGSLDAKGGCRYDLNRSRIAIVGAGLFGRTLALTLLRKGLAVTLFDKDSLDGTSSCAFTGAGMLAPYCELDSSPELIFELGRDSTKLWAEILNKLPDRVFLQKEGTIVIAHPSDQLLLTNFHARISNKLQARSDDLVWLDAEQLSVLEPSLFGRFDNALFACDEGQIDNRELMRALSSALLDGQCDWKVNTLVQSVEQRTISKGAISELSTSAGKYQFDLVFDCRGMGGKPEFSELRGVRGEMLEVEAPDVVLTRPLRFLHPRYPIYIVPRPGKRFLIGATSLECEDYRPISVLSTLELLSAAYSVDPAFAYASVIDARVNCRPTLTNNQPLIQHSGGLIQVNGLYRHGFLLTPKLVRLLIDWLESKPIDATFSDLFKEVKQIAVAN
ncbi:glycine oxidase ThiO [soil metagenome]